MNLDYLDSYCERAAAAGVLAEPINAFSNVAFIIAAAMALRMVAVRGKLNMRHADITILCITLACIGLGSFAWHILPSGLTVTLDVIPITAFINIYLISCLRRIFRFSWILIISFVIMLQLANVLAASIFGPDTLHGTIIYLPTYGMLWTIIFLSITRAPDVTRQLINVTILWSVSLIARTIDVPICNAIPVGTHFIWHILNAIVLYKLLIILLNTEQVPRNEPCE